MRPARKKFSNFLHIFWARQNCEEGSIDVNLSSVNVSTQGQPQMGPVVRARTYWHMTFALLCHPAERDTDGIKGADTKEQAWFFNWFSRQYSNLCKFINVLVCSQSFKLSLMDSGYARLGKVKFRNDLRIEYAPSGKLI